MSRYDAESRSVRIAERAAEAWHGTQGGSRSEIAVGVVAALAMTRRRDRGGPDPAQALISSSDEDIAGMLSEIWSGFWIARPKLGRLTGPFAGWLDDEPRDPGRVRAAASVARAAAKAGLLDMAGTGSLRDCDVIGATYLHMRSDGARQARGEFYTPPAVCKMMAEMTLGTGPQLVPGMSIAEPAAGTGGMLRAAAEWIAEAGYYPADYWWVANDISPVSVAGLAVNCHLWGLGPHVIIGVADTLAEGNWPERAWREQQAVREHRDQLLGTARVLALLRNAGALLSGASAEVPAAVPPAPAQEPVRLPLPQGPGIQLSLFGGEAA